jgi:hypothetical protein
MTITIASVTFSLEDHRIWAFRLVVADLTAIVAFATKFLGLRTVCGLVAGIVAASGM